jgi:hypothetical protein
MGFLAPWFLAGIAAVGLPVWLHLLRRHRTTPLPFSSLMFFEKRTQSSVRQRKLRYLLLFSLRTVLLVLLALAFANPFFSTSVPVENSRKLVVVAVDRSFSMRTTGALAGTRLDEAKAKARDFVSGLAGGAQMQVLALDSQVEYLTRAIRDKSQAIEAVNSITPGDGRSSFGELARAARVLQQNAKAQLEVHFFSDLQQSSAPPSFADLDPGPHASIHLHPIEAAATPNWTVEAASAPALVWDSKPVTVTATVAGWHASNSVQRTASLFVDGKSIESKQVTIPANGQAQVQFQFTPGHGRHRGEIRLDEHDRLPQDDRFLFAVERAEPERILFLDSTRTGRGSLYYRAAIESVHASPFVVDTATIGTAGDLQFDKYAVVVLSDPGRLPGDFEKSLHNYVQNGGGLLLLAGPESAMNGSLPVTQTNVAEVNVRSRDQAVTAADTQHPALQNTNQFSGVTFSPVVRLQPSNVRVLLRTGDGAPVLVEQSVGGGRVLTMAATLDGATTNLPLQAAFVPFVQESALYLAGEEAAQSNMAVGSVLELRRSPQQTGSVSVTGPDDKADIPLNEAASAQNFRLDREGFYDVRRADGRRRLIAANADRRESDLAPMPSDFITLWQKSGDTRNAPVQTTGATTERPYSLWRYVLLLALLAAMVESVIASRYLSAKEVA